MIQNFVMCFFCTLNFESISVFIGDSHDFSALIKLVLGISLWEALTNVGFLLTEAKPCFGQGVNLGKGKSARRGSAV